MVPKELNLLVDDLESQISKLIVGHDNTIRLLLASIFSRGHCLLIGVPGLAKTLMVHSVAKALGVDFGRIQFTPDLMPSDILGSEFIREGADGVKLEYRKGPLFTQLLLADEINRTPPKTQSALLEAMQERKVTVAGENHPLPNPFWVVATQNPIEQEGTYPLPEAQLDRFMFSLPLEYTSADDEVEILSRTTIGLEPEVETVTDAATLLEAQALVKDAPVSDEILRLAVELVGRTRPGDEGDHEMAKNYVEWGAGPRASQYIVLGAKAYALMDGRSSPERSDLKAVASSVLSHRVLLNYRATGEGLSVAKVVDDLIADVLG